MKKLLLVASMLTISTMTFAKTSINSLPVLEEKIQKTRGIDSNIKNFQLESNFNNGLIGLEKSSSSISGFPITFCDNEGCETGYFDIEQHSWDDLMWVIDKWLNNLSIFSKY